MGPSDELDQLLRPKRTPSFVEAIRVWATERRWWIVAGLAAGLVVTFLVVPRGDRNAVDGLPVAASGIAAPGSAAPGPAAPGTPASGAAASGGASGVVVDPSSTTTTTAPSEVAVHVAGAVNLPGVVRLAAAGRVVDAVSAAGGPRPDADLDRVNLASPLYDGSRIYVPAIGESSTPTVVAGAGPAGSGEPSVGASGSGTATNPSGASAAAPVNINTATAAELETLPGIGPATAAAIIAHRERSGPFASPQALDDVRGIGPAKVEALADLVVVG